MFPVTSRASSAPTCVIFGWKASSIKPPTDSNCAKFPSTLPLSTRSLLTTHLSVVASYVIAAFAVATIIPAPSAADATGAPLAKVSVNSVVDTLSLSTVVLLPATYKLPAI